MAYTLRRLNVKARKAGLELIKGEGYFYWITTAGACPDINAVTVPHFNRMDRADWIWEFEDAMKQYKRGYRNY